MHIDYSVIRRTLESLKTRGVDYFDVAQYVRNSSHGSLGPNEYPDYYFSMLEEDEQQTSTELQTELLHVAQQLGNCVKQSSLLTEVDRRDLGTWIKFLRASLQLRQYETWETEVLHDEGTVLGVNRPGNPGDPLV